MPSQNKFSMWFLPNQHAMSVLVPHLSFHNILCPGHQLNWLLSGEHNALDSYACFLQRLAVALSFPLGCDAPVLPCLGRRSLAQSSDANVIRCSRASCSQQLQLLKTCMQGIQRCS